jgi:hypothetical protein
MHRPTVRTTRAIFLIVAALPGLLLAGCETLPERYSEEKLARVGRELTTADNIYAELGNATLVREDGRLWIYSWQDVVPYPSRSLLALHFDATGRLRSRELALGTGASRSELGRDVPNQQYCTAEGTCIEHGIYIPGVTDDSQQGGLQYDSTFSAVTVKGIAKSRVASIEAQPDQCLLSIWPGQEWDTSRNATMPPYGLALRIEGIPKWSYFRWIPSGSFARVVMPSGDHVVSVRDPSWDERFAHPEPVEESYTEHPLPTPGDLLEDLLLSPPSERNDLPPSSASLTCQAGEQVFVRVRASFKKQGGDHWFPIVLETVDATKARAMLPGMAQLLPPDY